jgi:hypothetical protein
VSETLPASTQSSSASPAFRIDQVAASPGLLPSTSATAISLTLAQGTSVLQPSTEPNDGTSDDDYHPRVSDRSSNVETTQRSYEPDTPADVSPQRHPSHDINHPESR